jgi:hypothetical protein
MPRTLRMAVNEGVDGVVEGGVEVLTFSIPVKNYCRHAPNGRTHAHDQRTYNESVFAKAEQKHLPRMENRLRIQAQALGYTPLPAQS